MRKLLTTTAILMMTGTAAFAATAVNGNYSVSYSATTGNAPTFESSFPSTGSSFTSSLPATAFTENLNVNSPTSTTDFFGVKPAGSCGYCNTASGTITVNFTFSGSTLPSYSDTAAYTANYQHQTDSVTWSLPDPIIVNFTNGEVLDVTLGNASDWTIYPTISFDLTHGPTTVPEPSSLALVGAGLLGLGFVVARNRRKAFKKAA